MDCECCSDPCPRCTGCNGKDEFGCQYWRKRCDGSRDGCVPCEKPFPPPHDHRPCHDHRPPHGPPFPPICGGAIERILRDPDLLLVAALMLVLSREKCDKKLLLALGYILLF